MKTGEKHRYRGHTVPELLAGTRVASRVVGSATRFAQFGDDLESMCSISRRPFQILDPVIEAWPVLAKPDFQNTIVNTAQFQRHVLDFVDRVDDDFRISNLYNALIRYGVSCDPITANDGSKYKAVDQQCNYCSDHKDPLIVSWRRPGEIAPIQF
jgi:hypothetical protein